ncbi:MAG: hypothetical protein ACKO3W_08295 [bacterium]
MRREDWIRLLEHHGEPEAAALPPDPTLLRGTRGEQVLWRACAGESIDPSAGITGAAGPLLATDAYLAIEVWAECELAAVHALFRVVRQRSLLKGDVTSPESEADPLARRLAEAIRWHLEHTQPDNSTNRPWALHAFLLADDGSGDASLYAETLLHNALATDARREPLSRWILADAARELRRAPTAHL